jgi:hypothetical protein
MITKDEIGMLLGVVKVAYSRSFSNENPRLMINLWHDMLCDEPLILVQSAIKKHIATCKFAPRVSEILDHVEHQKWELYQNHCILDDIISGKPKGDLPEAFYPRRVCGKIKAFELNSSQKINNEIKSVRLKQLEKKEK